MLKEDTKVSALTTGEDTTREGSAKARAFLKVPATCPQVSRVLAELKWSIMREFGVPFEDEARVDQYTQEAFCKIRDTATEPLRRGLVATERLLDQSKKNCNKLQNKYCKKSDIL